MVQIYSIIFETVDCKRVKDRISKVDSSKHMDKHTTSSETKSQLTSKLN